MFGISNTRTLSGFIKFKYFIIIFMILEYKI